MSLITLSEDTCYVTKSNIIHPRSGNAPAITAAETRAAARLADFGLTATTSGKIKTGN